MRDNDNNPQSDGKNAMVWQVMRTQVFMKAYMNQWVNKLKLSLATKNRNIPLLLMTKVSLIYMKVQLLMGAKICRNITN
jgi:hypothetical protein